MTSTSTFPFDLHVQAAAETLASETPTHTAILSDKSGSMASTIRLLTQSLSGTLFRLKPNLPSGSQFSYNTFNHGLTQHFQCQPCDEFTGLPESVANGGTALWDCMITVLENLAMIQFEGKKILIVLTDGRDENSAPGALEKLKGLLKDLVSDNFGLLFMGAKQDAIVTARLLGLPEECALTFSVDHPQEATRAFGDIMERCASGEDKTPSVRQTDRVTSMPSECYSSHVDFAFADGDSSPVDLASASDCLHSDVNGPMVRTDSQPASRFVDMNDELTPIPASSDGASSGFVDMNDELTPTPAPSDHTSSGFVDMNDDATPTPALPCGSSRARDAPAHRSRYYNPYEGEVPSFGSSLGVPDWYKGPTPW
jgi:hypothetical protein